MATKKVLKDGWYLEVTGDANDADYRTERTSLGDDKELAFWLFNKMKSLEGVPHWNDQDDPVVFDEELDYDDLFFELYERMPCDDQGPVHTITEVRLFHVKDGKTEEFESLDDEEVPTDKEIYKKLF